jgi:hypothetical protein
MLQSGYLYERSIMELGFERILQRDVVVYLTVDLLVVVQGEIMVDEIFGMGICAFSFSKLVARRYRG